MILFQIFRPADLIRRFTDSSRVDQKKSGTIAANNLVNSGYQFSNRDGDTEVGRDGQVLGKPGKAGIYPFFLSIVITKEKIQKTPGVVRNRKDIRITG